MPDQVMMDPSEAAIRNQERDFCVKIIQAEIDRVKDLLNLQDQAGWPVFNREQTEAGLAALGHAIFLLTGKEPEEPDSD